MTQENHLKTKIIFSLWCIVYVMIAISLMSCDIQKQALKQKNDIDFTERIETKEIRKGDTVTYIVPVIRYKDTIITTVSHQGTILKTYYDKEGNISKSDCISAEIDLLRNEIRILSDQSKTKESSKEENLNTDWILILGGVLVLMFFILIVALFIFFKQQYKKTDLLFELLKNKS